MLNDKAREISSSTSLQQFIKEIIGDAPKGIAIAINDVVIPQVMWGERVLAPNDKILVIKATPGG